MENVWWVRNFFLLPIFPQVDVILDGVDNDDWEDIAVNIEVAILRDNLAQNWAVMWKWETYTYIQQEGESFIYVSDTGDNDHDK